MSELKERERHLRAYTLEPTFVELLRSLVTGPSMFDDAYFGQYVEIVDAKAKGGIADAFSLAQLRQVLRYSPKAKPETMTGQWRRLETGKLQMEFGDEDDMVRHRALCRMLPTPEEIRGNGTIPITILLPSGMDPDLNNLEGVRPEWEFVDVSPADPSDVDVSPIQLFSILQMLGAIGTLNTSKNNAEFVRTLLACDPVRALLTPLRQGVNKPKIGPSDIGLPVYARMVAQLGTRNAQDGVTSQDFDRLRGRLFTPRARSFYIAVRPEACKDFFLNADPFGFIALRFQPQGEGLRFTTITLSDVKSPKAHELNRHESEFPGLSLSLEHLFTLTSGVAITFHVRAPNPRGNNAGLQHPTFVLPENWFDTASGLKAAKPDKGNAVRAGFWNDLRGDNRGSELRYFSTFRRIARRRAK
ncbi:hypothetical protein F6455_13050 [Proteobacteria bacterium 005FR1]|nr:hypothetical protein [Proteobacteria bacterium 005FR1]